MDIAHDHVGCFEAERRRAPGDGGNGATGTWGHNRWCRRDRWQWRQPGAVGPWRRWRQLPVTAATALPGRGVTTVGAGGTGGNGGNRARWASARPPRPNDRRRGRIVRRGHSDLVSAPWSMHRPAPPSRRRPHVHPVRMIAGAAGLCAVATAIWCRRRGRCTAPRGAAPGRPVAPGGPAGVTAAARPAGSGNHGAARSGSSAPARRGTWPTRGPGRPRRSYRRGAPSRIRQPRCCR